MLGVILFAMYILQEKHDEYKVFRNSWHIETFSKSC